MLDGPIATASAWVRRHGWAWLRHLLVGMTLSYLLALSAQVRAAVPFSPVPVTAQTFAVLLIGALLPRQYIWSTFGLYLVGGIAGLPYFAGSSLAGPTGGYLVGFILGATAISVLLDRGWGRHPVTILLALLLGNVLIYAAGLPWLALFVGSDRAVALGLLPFVVGDLLKLVSAAGIVWARRRL